MKISIKTWLAVLCLVMGGNTAGLAQADDNKLVIALSQPGKAGLLKVNLIQGDIKVSGYNGKDVTLRYNGRENRKHANTEESSGLRRLTSNSVGMEVEEEGNTVTIRSSAFMKPVDLEIQVPHDFSVNLESISGGQILVEDVNGKIDVVNINGNIALRNVSGSASASTLNGNILANFRKVTPNMPMAFSNMNGKIDVTLPASAKFNAKLKADNGDVFTDFDMALDKEGKSVQKGNEGQSNKIYLDKWMYGKINGGGPEMMFKNFNGNIYLRKGK
jgi:DUF4097 and DUF4098 domain-containing protein YvlB